jgi:Biotin and Thiamin Synthesis associated domain
VYGSVTETEHPARAQQALCFLAGANSIFDGDKLLTTPNNERSEDLAMFEALGLTSRPAFWPAGYPAGMQCCEIGCLHLHKNLVCSQQDA